MQLLLPRGAAALIRQGGSHGVLNTRVSGPDNVAAVVGVSDGAIVMRRCPLVPATHFLNNCDLHSNGRWFRASSSPFPLWLGARVRRAALPPATLAECIDHPLPTVATEYLAITYSPADTDTAPDMLGWIVGPDGAAPIDLEVEPEVAGIAALAPGWPTTEIQALRVLLVGAGSIGSATAYALADYGLGHLTVIDPDRLRWHNLVRHRCGARHVGALKVTALAHDLAVARPDTRVEPHPLDVVQDADLVRSLLTHTDVVVCCADGVVPRRVVSHLARQAKRTAVLGCVLEDGAIGEVLRLRPWRDHGCLACRREALRLEGGIDPEPGLDAGYGTGTAHRPMTAVGGDLTILGDLVASTVVHTALERAGYAGHRLPGEHAVVALRPTGSLAAPFNATHALDVRWFPAPLPRATCPTCAPAPSSTGSTGRPTESRGPGREPPSSCARRAPRSPHEASATQ